MGECARGAIWLGRTGCKHPSTSFIWPAWAVRPDSWHTQSPPWLHRQWPSVASGESNLRPDPHWSALAEPWLETWTRPVKGGAMHTLEQVKAASPLATGQPKAPTWEALSPVTVYDAFLFSGEFDLLYLRVSELDPIVDYFMVVEATTTFQGEPRSRRPARERSSSSALSA